MKIIKKTSAFLLLLSMVLWSPDITHAATFVDLESANEFAILAGSGITDTNPSVIVGSVGLSPTTGAAIGLTDGEVTGTIYAVDAFGPAGSVENPSLLTTAKSDLTAAYILAEGQAATTIATELGNTTQTAGVYETASGEFAITGTVTLDAEGNADAVFIFQAGSTLITASDSKVVLLNGAQACNVFWQVTSAATLGTNSDFKGNILALVSITDDGGSTVEGRLLARNGAVTVNDTNVTTSDCNEPAPVVSVSSSSSNQGGFKRCDTPSTPTCVEYFSATTATVIDTTPPEIAGTSTAALPYIPSLPNTGGSFSSFFPLLAISLVLSGAGIALTYWKKEKLVIA